MRPKATISSCYDLTLGGQPGIARAASIVLTVFTVLAAAQCRNVAKMSFFVTSVAAGDGGNLGGLTGADAHCQRLALPAGSRKEHWHAYLSAAAEGAHAAVNARDRIGAGPWFNAKGVEIAKNVEDLHGAGNQLGEGTSLDEKGGFVFAGMHDILTGSNADGTLAAGDTTCGNWTSTHGHAMVGHSNKAGSIGGDRARSWNSAHLSVGCTMGALRTQGGGGLLYCFAVDRPQLPYRP